MFMGIKKLPAEKDYWATNSLGDGMIKSLFPNRDRWIFLKQFFSVSNPSAELNDKDKLAKVRPFLEYVNTTVKKYWKLGPHLVIDESQAKCSHQYVRILYRGETKKPLSDYVKIVSVHESGTGYCWGFEIDTREHTIAYLMNAVALQVPNMDGARTFSVDRELNSVDNCVMIHKAGHYVY